MLEINNLHVSYGNRTVLEDVTATFEKGTINVIVGRNGTGKSTLLKAITGIKRVQGDVILDDVLIRDMSHQERACHLGYLPQIVKAPDMSVEALVAHGRFSRLGFSKKLNEADFRSIEKALDMTGMTAYRMRSLSTLSGGELRKAYCAMLMAQDPDYMLLDEPTAFLDTTATLNLMALLKELAESGKCIIMACHDLPQAFTYADRIILLSDHRVAADDSPQSLIRHQTLLKETIGIMMREIDDPDACYHYILVEHN